MYTRRRTGYKAIGCELVLLENKSQGVQLKLESLIVRPAPAQPANPPHDQRFADCRRAGRKRDTGQTAAEVQVRHLKKMESLAAREAQLWQEIVDLLEQKTASAYEQAVQHLADLHDLGQHQGEQTAFQTRLNKIYRDYHNRSALIRRLHQAKLYGM
jgi:hypothetical protein